MTKYKYSQFTLWLSLLLSRYIICLKSVLLEKWKVLRKFSFQIQRKVFYKTLSGHYIFLLNVLLSRHGNVCTTLRHSFPSKREAKNTPTAHFLLQLDALFVIKHRHYNQTFGQVNCKWFKTNTTSLEVIAEFAIHRWLFCLKPWRTPFFHPDRWFY